MLSFKSLLSFLQIFFLCSNFMACNSSANDNKNKENVSKDLRTWSNQYRNENIDVARTETLKIIDKIKHYKEVGLEGLNFDLMLGFMYARLYLIEEEKGDQNKAREFIDKSIEYLSEPKPLSEVEIEAERNRIIEFVRELDCTHYVRWMNCTGSENQEFKKGTM